MFGNLSPKAEKLRAIIVIVAEIPQNENKCLAITDSLLYNQFR